MLKNTAIWLKTLALPSVANGEHARDRGAGVLGDAFTQHIVDDAGLVLTDAVPRIRCESGDAHRRRGKADEASAEHDDWKRNVKEEDADEGDRRERDHHLVLERPLADANQGLDHDSENRRLQAEEQRDDDRHSAPGRVDVAQRHDGDDAGNDKKPAGDDAAERAMHQPADIGRKLLRLWARQQHAIVERMQEALLRHPALLLDQDAMHDRDLTGGAAEAEPRDLQPGQERLAQRDAVIELRPRLSDGELSQLCASLAGLNFRVVAHSTSVPIAASSGSTRRGR